MNGRKLIPLEKDYSYQHDSEQILKKGKVDSASNKQVYNEQAHNIFQ